VKAPLRRVLILFSVAALAGAAAAACGGGAATPAPTPVLSPAPGMNAPGVPVIGGDVVSSPSGLKYVDELVGKGAPVSNGQKVSISYQMWVVPSGQSVSGAKPLPLTFTLGDRQVLKGIEEGVSTMRVGGKRRLLVPPDLGYGAAGLSDQSNFLVAVPGNSTLLVDIQVTAAK